MIDFTVSNLSPGLVDVSATVEVAMADGLIHQLTARGTYSPRIEQLTARVANNGRTAYLTLSVDKTVIANAWRQVLVTDDQVWDLVVTVEVLE